MLRGRRFWGQEDQGEAYVESQIARETTHFFEAMRVKAPDAKNAKEVFVAAIKERFGVEIYPSADVYAEPAGPEGWWRCSAHQREADSR